MQLPILNGTAKPYLVQIVNDDEIRWQRFLQEGLLPHQHMIGNAVTEVSTLLLGDQQFPVTVNFNGAATTSWVASLRNSYGPYARAETDLVRMHRLLKPLYRAASHAAEALLCAGGLAGGAFVNNWLLATNLYPEKMPNLCALRDATLRRYPNMPVIFRSLTPPLHASLLVELRQQGFILLPTRQVWITESLTAGRWRLHTDVKRDIRLEERATLGSEWIEGSNFTDLDFKRAVTLYNALYRGKYPVFNPDYAENFFRIGVKTGWLRLYGLRRAESNPLAGIVGIIKRGNVCTTPVLGYDLEAPIQHGLYRRLMLKAFLETERLSNILHCSGGAGSFKFQRGARPSVEFAAIWLKNLPVHKQAAIKVLNQMIERLALPYLEKRTL